MHTGRASDRVNSSRNEFPQNRRSAVQSCTRAGGNDGIRPRGGSRRLSGSRGSCSRGTARSGASPGRSAGRTPRVARPCSRRARATGAIRRPASPPVAPAPVSSDDREPDPRIRERRVGGHVLHAAVGSTCHPDGALRVPVRSHARREPLPHRAPVLQCDARVGSRCRLREGSCPRGEGAGRQA